MANKDHFAEELNAEIAEHVEALEELVRQLPVRFAVKEQLNAEIAEHVKALEELVRQLPVRFAVKEQLTRSLVEWQDEVTDATTLSLTDW